MQTIQEATDLSASLVTDEVTRHGGSDGQAVVSIEGGVAPYTENWGGYDPGALEAGNHSVTVFDDNLCQQSLSFLITELEFSFELTATVPDCNDPNSGTIEADVIGYGGPVELNWGDANPDMAAAENTPWSPQTRLDVLRSPRSWWIPHIPEDLELNETPAWPKVTAPRTITSTLGSNHTWTYTGAEEQQVFNSFAIR